MKKFLLLLVLLAAVAGGFVLFSIYSPYQGFTGEVFLDFPKGTSTRAMAARLAAAGVIRDHWQFAAVRAIRPSAKLQAGEYRFSGPASAAEIFSRIARGDIYYHEVTVPEGSNIFDIAAIADQTGIIGSKEFLAAAADTAPVKDLDPGVKTLEGYLFPSTYRITRHTTAQQLVRMMTDQFHREWKSLNVPDSKAHDVVTLASLVEKETGAKSERPLVASVFANRLRLGMKLDCDPTTIYAAMMEARYRGTIHQSDLASKNEYNTYQHAGLPPGPITNPGLASLKAAIAPAQTNYLYFVAKPGGAGSHNFAGDLAAHARNVDLYRRGVKAAQ